MTKEQAGKTFSGLSFFLSWTFVCFVDSDFFVAPNGFLV